MVLATTYFMCSISRLNPLPTHSHATEAPSGNQSVFPSEQNPFENERIRATTSLGDPGQAPEGCIHT